MVGPRRTSGELAEELVMRTCSVPALPGSRQAVLVGRWYLSKFIPLARFGVLAAGGDELGVRLGHDHRGQRLEVHDVEVTPFLTTACLGSGKRIDAGVTVADAEPGGMQ